MPSFQWLGARRGRKSKKNKHGLAPSGLPRVANVTGWRDRTPESGWGVSVELAEAMGEGTVGQGL